MTIKEICNAFLIKGKYVGCEEINTGIINSTYKVTFLREGEQKCYAVQKINKTVFKNPPEVMENMVSVTDFVRENIEKKGLSTRRFVLRAFKTKEGKSYITDEFGDYWRCVRFIKDSVTYDSTDDYKIIESVGSAFGLFQNCLDGFDASTLYITIPDFHNTPKRYEALKLAIERDEKGRVASVKKEISDLLSFEKQACLLQTYFEEGQLPLRVTHNDTKCNNVSFDKNTGEALAVLDLDTVMPGLIAHDFGDAIRFIANTTIEDDPDIASVNLDLGKFEAFTKGFVSQLKESLTDFEKQTLWLGALTLTVELAVRFLTDYINGDVYFKVKYPGHNLDRARNQIALAKSIEKNKTKIQKIIKKYL